VLLETHDAFSSGADVAPLLAAAGATGTGVIWDVHHPVAMGEAPAQTARLIGGRTHHVHVKDGKGGEKLTLLGEGDVPLRDILAELHKGGYKGFLSFEWEKAWIPELPGPEVAFPQAAAYLSGLLKELEIPRS
jgi:sugar phosphate isomerase/epimerase